MNTIEQQIINHIAAHEHEIPIYQAPDNMNKIWSKHKKNKRLRFISIAASALIFSLTLFHVANFTPQANTVAPWIAKSQQLELDLAQLTPTVLQMNEQQIIVSWQIHLALIDSELATLKPDSFAAVERWKTRSQLLEQMIALYQQPTTTLSV